MCAFLQIWRWVLLPILVGNDLPRHDLPYSKGFMKFGCQEPSKKCLTFETLVRQRGVWPVCKGPPLWNFGISNKLNFFQWNDINHGVKSVLPFSILITEKSQVFSMHLYVYLPRYTQIRDRGGTMCPTLGPGWHNL